MLASPQKWRVTYPRRSPHPRRPAMRSDGQGWAPSSPPNSPPVLALRPQPPLRESTAACQSSRDTMFAGGASGGRAQASVGRQGGAGDRGRAVRFEPVVKLILVPSRLDLGDARLSEELWWNEDDYLQFRLGAIVDGSAEPFCRTLRSRRSRRKQSMGTGTAARSSAQAPGRADYRSGSMHPLQLQQRTSHRVSSSSSAPSSPLRLRFQPGTDPSFPVARNVEGVIDRDSGPPTKG